MPCVIAVFGGLGLIDLTFLASNSLKIAKAAGCRWRWRRWSSC